MKSTEQNLKPRVGVGIVVINDKKILLGKRKGSHGSQEWSFPGGHLEFGETVEECAFRELYEETGLKALSMQMGPWVDDIIENEKHYVTLFVIVNQFEGDLQLMEPDKCEGWHWFDENSLPSPLFSPVRSLIKKLNVEHLASHFSF